MPINRDFIGRTYPLSRPYEVGREKIREFADSLGDSNPVYRDPAAAEKLGHPDVIAPPTFAIALTMDIGGQAIHDPEMGVDYSRVVHGEQRFVHHRPIYAGDVLVGALTVSDIRSAGRNEVVTTRVDLETTDGELVCTSLTTLVVRGGE
jgi:acyl dehydratase